jgi:nucleoside-diphosphate-sugar epimerase
MRIVVTGAGGFIGAVVVDELLAAGHEVVAVDRAPGRLAHRPAGAVGRPVLEIGDLGDPAWAGDLVRRVPPEALIHLAWYADPNDYLTSPENVASLAMTTAFIRAAIGAGCRKAVLAGSCVEYATADRPLRETDPVVPRTLYAACKHAAGIVAGALAAPAGAELAWARIFHLHGPGESERRLIPWVARELRAGRPVELTDGTQIRDHLHVADVARGLVALLQPGAAGEYNVSSGEPVSLRRVLETVGDIVGGKHLLKFGARPHRPGETMFLAGDSGRLRALGWTPRFGLRDGLENALAG